MPIPFVFVDPWGAVAERERDALERELLREVAPRHVLFGRPARAVARRRDRDDVLFELTDSGECAVVHLTWTSAPKDVPPYPHSRTYENLSSWAGTAMLSDHAEFDGGG